MDPQPKSLMDLRVALPKAVASVPKNEIREACMKFYDRLKLCVENDGHVFEHKIGKK